MPHGCDNKDPPKPVRPKFDPHEHEQKSEKDKKIMDDLQNPCGSKKNKSEKVDSKVPQKKDPKPVGKTDTKTAGPEKDPCAKYYPKGLDAIFKKQSKPWSSSSKKTGPSVCNVKIPKRSKKSDSIINKIKFPVAISKNLPTGLSNKIKLPTNLLNDLKNRLPDLKDIKNIEYGKLFLYGYCRISHWIRDNCNPKKMADKGSGAPARPMKFPYTFSAKIAQFPMGHYVKNQWIWKYYVVAFAACVPIFYSINKLSNSPGNVAKWAEIRRKEAAEHHH